MPPQERFAPGQIRVDQGSRENRNKIESGGKKEITFAGKFVRRGSQGDKVIGSNVGVIEKPSELIKTCCRKLGD